MRGSHRLFFGVESKNARRDVSISAISSYATLLPILLLLASASLPVTSAYSLTSSGIWPSLSGGDPNYYQGINTQEVRWGNPALATKSGLRYDGQRSDFSFGQDFCLGKLTHYNYPTYAGTSATGAKLKVTLKFNDLVVPDTSFYFDLRILETTNGYPCPEFQKSSTPCDDLVWWSNIEASQSFTLQNGEAYSLMIVGFSDSFPSGSPVSQFVTEEQKANVAYLIGRIIPCLPTTISVQPSDISVCQGQDATLTVTANGTGLTYQWYKGSTPLTDGGDTSGATSPTLKIATAASSDAGSYKVTINGAGGSVTSNAAVLTVNALPIITRQPSDQTSLCEGSQASFSVDASGATSYQWQVSTNGGSSWDNIFGATASTYVINPVLGSIHNNNKYRVVLSNSFCSITSNVATLTVNKPWITAQPANKTVCSGATATFSASITTSGSTSYRWQVSKDGGSTWSDIAGASSTSYSFTAKPEHNGNMYRIKVSSKGSCTVYSTAATLTVNTALQFTTHPASQVVCEGQVAAFTVALSGGVTSGQWQYRTGSTGIWTDIPGQTATTLYLYNVGLSMNGYEYRYTATNSCGLVNSNSASLNVNPVTIQIEGKNVSCIIKPSLYSPRISGTCNTQYQFAWMIDGSQVSGIFQNGSISVNWKDYGSGNHLIGMIVNSIDDQGNAHYLGQIEMKVTVIDIPGASIEFV